MSDSWLERLPTHERQRLIERFTEVDPERRKKFVVGPERMKQMLQENEVMANLKFALETEPKLREALRSQMQEDIAEHGFLAVLGQELKGDFDVKVAEHPQTHDDQIVAVPEGNVQESIPLQPTFNEQYLSQFQQQMSV
jgi:hypothetical protein